ncbi:hypothetical protein [Bacillus cereus]|uniref:hypothetical protein n=1 Tax=Bacillus cereus TaxID=1396 RepID=UPI001C8B418B|nr:hypothetical protein [Bacillus cereus]MBX9158283.1 hypothetical protein [Bacillus cereus]
MVQLLKETLANGLKTAGKIITNKRIELLDDNYLRVVNKDGGLYFASVGENHTLVQKLADGLEDAEQELCLEYNKLLAPLSELGDELDFQMLEDKAQVTSGRIVLNFKGYEGDSVLDKVNEAKETIDRVKEDGEQVVRAEFLDVLSYLHSLRDKNASDDLQDIYFTDNKSFVRGTRFAVRMDYSIPVNYGISSDASDTLISMLDSSDEEHFYMLLEDNTVYFVVGEDFYQVDDVNRVIRRVNDSFNEFSEDVKLPLSKTELVSYVKLAIIFTEDDEDILITVDNGVGKIKSDSESNENGDNASDGEFSVPEDVADFEIAVNGDDILTVFGGLSGTVADEVELQLSLDSELAYFRHSKGDCLLSIRNLEE